MTLQLKRCVSLFVCLSLLLSACSPDKSNKASSNKTGSTVDMARNQSNIQGLAPQPQNTDTSAGNNRSRWYKPTWYTVATEGIVGVAGVTITKMISNAANTKEMLVYDGTIIGAVLGAGEVARAVTTGFELEPVAGGFAGLASGAVAGAMTGATLFSVLVVRILEGDFDNLFPAIKFGAGLGAIFGGITGLLTGLETGYFARRPKKLDNQKQSANETTNNATTKDNPKAETGGAKA